MPHVPYHLIGALLFIVPLIAQVVVYKVVARFFAEQNASSVFLKRYLPALIVLVNIPFLLVRIDPGMFMSGPMRHLVLIPYYAYETLSVTILFFALLSLLLKLILRPLHARKRQRAALQSHWIPPESRRLFIKKAAIGIGAYTFLGAMYSIYDRDDYRVDYVPLRLKSLPTELAGLRIAMISDVHSGLYMTEEDMSMYCEAVNNLNPDLIFIPGDFVTFETKEIVPFVKSFAGLKSKFGIYACLGNHDFFADPDIITEKLRENGINVLRNQTQELDINNGRLILSGVDDGMHAKFRKVSYEANSVDTARILLCHKPYYFERAVAGGFDAMLSGHTHGGQIVLANLLGLKLTPAALFSPYVSGRYTRGDSTMYVSRGVGTVGLPVRLNCPPEITVFTLEEKT